MTHLGDAGPNICLGPDAMATLPKSTRTPYLHFLVDRSAGSDVTSESLRRAVTAAQKQLPDARKCLVTLVNYEINDLTSELKPIESAFSANLSALPRRGGFMAGRAMKRAMLNYHDAFVKDGPDNRWLTSFPVFVLVQGSRSSSPPESDLATFAEFAPDLPIYYVSSGGNGLEARDFHGAHVLSQPVQPVVLLKAGNAIEACPAIGNQSEVLDFAAGEDTADLTAFDQTTHSFVPVPVNTTIPSETKYAAGLAAWREYLDSIHNPSSGPVGFSKVVRKSRDSGILVGSTSYIVVENSAQWKMLERKQKQKLGNESVLEFEAVPEPSTWCLIIFGGGMLLFFGIRRKRRCL